MTNYAKSNTGFKIFSTILKPVFKFWYTPKLIGKENIPESGAIVVACNHKHLMDQCMVIISTKRPIHYMAKSEYFEKNISLVIRFYSYVNNNCRSGILIIHNF